MTKRTGHQDIDGERLHLSQSENTVDGEIVAIKTRKQTLYFSAEEAKRLASNILYFARRGEAVG